MIIFTYVLYRTKRHSGTFRMRIDSNTLSDTLTASQAMKDDEYSAALNDFKNCMLKLDSGTPINLVFSKSSLSPEAVALYLLSYSNQISRVLNLNEHEAIHVVYHADILNMENNMDSTGTSVVETIYPGPALIAPEPIIEEWLKSFPKSA